MGVLRGYNRCSRLTKPGERVNNPGKYINGRDEINEVCRCDKTGEVCKEKKNRNKTDKGKGKSTDKKC